MHRQAHYYIVHDRNQWLIKYDDEEYGPYLSQAEATQFAFDAARKVTDPGENAVVYLMVRNGHIRYVYQKPNLQ